MDWKKTWPCAHRQNLLDEWKTRNPETGQSVLGPWLITSFCCDEERSRSTETQETAGNRKLKNNRREQRNWQNWTENQDINTDRTNEGMINRWLDRRQAWSWCAGDNRYIGGKNTEQKPKKHENPTVLIMNQYIARCLRIYMNINLSTQHYNLQLL